MLTALIFIVLLASVIVLGLLAAWSDVCRLKIPNTYSLLIVLIFALAYSLLQITGHKAGIFSGPFLHIGAFAAMFVGTAVLFALNIMGAGDSKLASAFALWVGWQGLLPFIVYTVFIGGLLGIISLIVKKYRPFSSLPAGSWFERLQKGESKVPYGLAITLGALLTFAYLGYFNPETYYFGFEQ